MPEYLPNGKVLRMVSMDETTLVGSVLWIRAVLLFADVAESGNPKDVAWLRAMLNAVAILDPTWRTVYLYGGGLLRVCGDIEGSDALYRRGVKYLPNDPYFPFSLGMNAYLYHHDAKAAAEWLDRAAALPGAPAWYRAAAASFLEEEGQRHTAIEYLRRRLAQATEPAVRRVLKGRLDRLVHDELASRLEARRKAFTAEHGRDIRSPDELGELPEDPYGEGWILSPDGPIRSRAVDRDEAERERQEERAMLMGRPSDRSGGSP